jgi:hypothetical protein
VCSAYIPEILTPDFDVTMYYENSNIFPAEEFKRRSDSAKFIAKTYGATFIEVPQDQDAWNLVVAGHAKDPENGERCGLCMKFRLERAFAYAKTHDFDMVACTLGVSRRKQIETVNNIGCMLSKEYDIPFMDRDWKKNNGEVESQRRAKAFEIYRQDYCGCVYSLKTKN